MCLIFFVFRRIGSDKKSFTIFYHDFFNAYKLGSVFIKFLLVKKNLAILKNKFDN